MFVVFEFVTPHVGVCKWYCKFKTTDAATHVSFRPFAILYVVVHTWYCKFKN
jgi:hypothetical protein